MYITKRNIWGCVAFAAAMICAPKASARDIFVTENGVTMLITTDMPSTGEATVTQLKIVSSEDFNGTVSIPANVKYGQNEYSVTATADMLCQDIDNSGNFPIERLVFPEGFLRVGKASFSGCRSLRSVDFPSTLTEIDDHAFENTALTSITLPPSLEKVGMWAFQILVPGDTEPAFDGLENVVFHTDGKLDRIAQSTFKNRRNLKEVTLGRGITAIEKFAFQNCPSLVNLTLYSPEPPAISLDARMSPFVDTSFNNVTYDETTVLRVPKGSVSKYRESPWGEVFANITECDSPDRPDTPDTPVTPPTPPAPPTSDEMIVLTVVDGTHATLRLPWPSGKSLSMSAESTAGILKEALISIADGSTEKLEAQSSVIDIPALNSDATLMLAYTNETQSGITNPWHENPDFRITVSGNEVRISGIAEGETVKAFNVSGICEASATATYSGCATLRLQSGLYLIVTPSKSETVIIK